MFGSKPPATNSSDTAVTQTSADLAQKRDLGIVPKSQGDATAVSSVIATGVAFDGKLYSSSHVFIDGEIVGEVLAPSVSFGRSGTMSGKLQCESAVIDGRVEGELICQDLVLGAHSSVHGTVSCQSLKVGKGASITGDVSVTQAAEGNG